MTNRGLRLRLSPKVVAAALLVISFPVAAARFDPAYPHLDAKQVGTVRHLVKLALQPYGDWSEMEMGAPGPGAQRPAFDDLHYQLPWMTYALAVVQSQVTPAYRELYKNATDRNVNKMLLNDVWEQKWLRIISSPRYRKYLDSGKDWRDPVAEKNIMYSGHLLQMIGLYEVLYADRKWDKPGAMKFTLADDPAFSHSYSHADLAKAIQSQFVNMQFIGIECEPNVVFASCNQHPVLGLMSFDQIHKTNLADVREAFYKKATELGYINGAHRIQAPYRVQEKQLGKSVFAGNDAWTGMMMHVWERDVVSEELYPAQRDASVKDLLSLEPETVRRTWASPMSSTNFGAFAAYAAELGDQDTRNALLAYADSEFHPVWQDGSYVYPRHDVDFPKRDPSATPGDSPMGSAGGQLGPGLRDDQLSERVLGPLSGNAMLALAILNPGQGLWNTYNNLTATYIFGGPEVVDVAYPRVIVTQAYYDQPKETLAIGLVPGSNDVGKISFRVRNLKQKGSYAILIDGQSAVKISAGQVHNQNHEVALRWTGSGELAFDLILGDGKSILIRGTGGALVASR